MSGLYKSCAAKNAIFRPSTQTPQNLTGAFLTMTLPGPRHQPTAASPRFTQYRRAPRPALQTGPWQPGRSRPVYLSRLDSIAFSRRLPWAGGRFLHIEKWGGAFELVEDRALH